MTVALGAWTAAGALGTAALAGLLRGFTGFGLALAAVPALTLVADPVEVVPCVILLQVIAGLQLLPRTWRDADWRALAPLLVAALVATPLGTVLLDDVPADPMRAAIGVVVLAAVVLLGAGVAPRDEPSLAAKLAIGAVSGLLNGSTAMAGPPVIVYFLATQRSAAASRASLLTYFFVLSLAGLASVAAAGLVSSRTWLLGALMLPAVVLGNALGDRFFDRSSPHVYRRAALGVLTVLALLALARALAG
ncbi:MAG: sulfite exporter TauE/SafE family protein [Thermodesulfobacteriota bacterium]